MHTNNTNIAKKDNFLNKVLGTFKLKKGVYSFINPYSVGIAIDNEDTFQNLDGIYVDGILLVKILNKLGFDVKDRISFDYTSIAGTIFDYATENHLSIALVGSTKKDIEKFKEKLINSYSDINIAYYRSGFFSSKNERNTVLDKITEINPDVIICGMGTPHQEVFLTDLKHRGWHGYGYTCGGFFHQTARSNSESQYYPYFINKFNLRAIYRMWDEPKLIKRYFFDYPKFIYKLVKYIKH